jgi:hypothetical protein
MTFLKTQRISIAKLFIFISFIFIIFRATIAVFVGMLSFLIIPFILLVSIIWGSAYLFGKPIPKRFTAILIFFLYLLLSFFLFFIVNIHFNITTPFIGLLNLSLMLLFWAIILMQNKDNLSILIEYYKKLIIGFGLINAVGAIIQFFVSPTLFGLVTHAVYGDEKMLAYPNIAKRAISFISSPQALAIFLSLTLICIWYYPFKSKTLKFLCFSLVLFSCVLTGSKAFFIFFLFFLLAKLIFEKSIMAGISLLTPLLAIPYVLINTESVFRMFDILTALVNITTSSRFLIWKSFIFYDTNFFQFLFGHGLGVLSRGAQIIGNYEILNGSTESFLIHIYFEIGIIGFCLFLYIYIKSLINLLSHKEYRYFGFILFAFFGNIAFVPTFYAFNTAFYYWAIILFGIALGKQKKSNKKIISETAI